MIKTKLRFYRDKDDPEKAVLPAILYVSTSHPEFNNPYCRGFCLVFWWWDFGVSIFFLYVKKQTDNGKDS